MKAKAVQVTIDAVLFIIAVAQILGQTGDLIAESILISAIATLSAATTCLKRSPRLKVINATVVVLKLLTVIYVIASGIPKTSCEQCPTDYGAIVVTVAISSLLATSTGAQVWLSLMSNTCCKDGPGNNPQDETLTGREEEETVV